MVTALMSRLNEFAASTSMHGINRIKAAATSTHRSVWMCLVLAATCGFFYHVNTLICTYFEYPVSMSTKVGAVDFEFPDVTVCLSGTVPHGTYEFSEIKKEMDQIEVQWITMNLLNLRNSSNKEIITEGNEKKMLKIFPLIRFSSFAQTDLEIAKEDLIIWCRFFGHPCNDNFTKTTQMGYPGCYTIAPSTLPQSNAAERHALSLILYIPRDSSSNLIKDVDELLSLTKGIRVAITPPGVQPNPKLHGIDVTVGSSTSVRLHMMQTRLQNTPTKKCRATEKHTIFMEENGPKKKNYDTFDCYEQSFQNFIFDKCKCISPHYRVMAPYNRSSLCHYVDKRKICFLENKTCDPTWITELAKRIECHDKYRRQITASVHITDCQPPCKTSRYIKSTSFNSWPIEGAMSTLWEMVQKAYHKSFHVNNNHTVIDAGFKASFTGTFSRNLTKETLLKLEIFAQSPKGDLIEETLTYSIAKLFSDFGGNLGLWVGVSVLTVAEVLELIVGTFLSVTYATSYLREDEKRKKLQRRKQGVSTQWSNDPDSQEDIMLKNILNVVGALHSSVALTGTNDRRKQETITSIDSLYAAMTENEGLSTSFNDLGIDNPNFYEERV